MAVAVTAATAASAAPASTFYNNKWYKLSRTLYIKFMGRMNGEKKRHFKCSNKIQWFYWVVLRAIAASFCRYKWYVVGTHRFIRECVLCVQLFVLDFIFYGLAWSGAQNIADVPSVTLIPTLSLSCYVWGWWCERSYASYTYNICINSSDSSWSGCSVHNGITCRE